MPSRQRTRGTQHLTYAQSQSVNRLGVQLFYLIEYNICPVASGSWGSVLRKKRGRDLVGTWAWTTISTQAAMGKKGHTWRPQGAGVKLSTQSPGEQWGLRSSACAWWCVQQWGFPWYPEMRCWQFVMGNGEGANKGLTVFGTPRWFVHWRNQNCKDRCWISSYLNRMRHEKDEYLVWIGQYKVYIFFIKGACVYVCVPVPVCVFVCVCICLYVQVSIEARRGR